MSNSVICCVILFRKKYFTTILNIYGRININDNHIAFIYRHVVSFTADLLSKAKILWVIMNSILIVHIIVFCKINLLWNVELQHFQKKTYTLDYTASAWPRQVKFTVPGHIFTYLGFPECPCFLEWCDIYFWLCYVCGLMLLD